MLQVQFDDSHCVRVTNDGRVNVHDVALVVWPGTRYRHFRASIDRQIAKDATNRTCLPLAEIETSICAWGHRDASAPTHFDFEHLRTIVTRGLRRARARTLAGMQMEINEAQARIASLEEARARLEAAPLYPE